MAVVLRLARYGVPKRPFYRIVACEKQKPRDGRYLELVGTYSPMTDPPKITLKEDKIKKWIAVGATPSRIVRNLIIKTMPGLIEAREKHQLAKIQARRKARKAKAGKSAPKEKKSKKK